MYFNSHYAVVDLVRGNLCNSVAVIQYFLLLTVAVAGIAFYGNMSSFRYLLSFLPCSTLVTVYLKLQARVNSNFMLDLALLVGPKSVQLRKAASRSS